MRREIHLICNAHLDPMWLWEWEEGAAEAISTFRTAARLCEESDNFVFCHNEALLYEWVLEYEPTLFERIKKLVKEGKWVIMGGYYLQPDCNIPSGEAMIRQIEVGNRFFMKHFGIKCKTAINFDSFGHSRGLVQVMKKMGYENYLICRPTMGNTNKFKNEFTWVGYDGSRINVRRHYELYNSALGHALDKVKYNIENIKDEPLMILWGVGNHGGGPSRKDIDDINGFISEKNEEFNILHSNPDDYFKSAKDNFSNIVVAESLWPCNTGCYTSISRIKQKYRQLERELFNAEKISTMANLIAGMDYPKELEDAERDMVFNQFHDVLPGTVVKNAETAALRMMDHGLEIISRIKTRAFFKLSNKVKYTANGNYPIFVWNPLPYRTKRIVEVEFQLKDQNWEDNFTFMHVYDRNGNLLKSQIEKEASNLNLDWRKHVTFEAVLNPMSINFFECRPYKVNALSNYPIIHGIKEFKCTDMDITFDFDTGLITSIKKNDIEYISSPALKLSVFSDTEDPWAMTQDRKLGEKIGEFKLADKKTGTLLSGVEKELNSARIIEDGDIRTVVECVYTYGMSDAIVRYGFNKMESAIDVSYKILFNENSKCLKLEIPPSFDGRLIGKEMFGREELSKSGSEVIFHDYVGLFNNDDTGIYVINNGTYGGSFENDKLYISMLRTPAYTGHPINDRTILKQDRHTDRIDIGYREFAYRISIGSMNDAEQASYENENKYFSLSFFTNGGEDDNGESGLVISNPKVELISFRRKNDGIYYRIYNGCDTTQTATIRFDKLGYTKEVSLGKFEFEELKIKGD